MAFDTGTDEGREALKAKFDAARGTDVCPDAPEDITPERKLVALDRFLKEPTNGLDRGFCELDGKQRLEVIEHAEAASRRMFFGYTRSGTLRLSLDVKILNAALHKWRRQHSWKHRAVVATAQETKGLRGNLATVPPLKMVPLAPGVFVSKDGRVFSVKELSAFTPKGKTRAHVKIKVNGKFRKVPRAQIVAAAKFGYWTVDTVAHVNGNPSDDRWDNISIQTVAEQQDSRGVIQQ